MGLFQINKKLLPMKMHYFIGISASAPIMPFLATILKQRGYSAFIVGLVFTALPIPGLLIRPAVGALTDKYKCRKSALIGCSLIIVPLVCTLWFIPGATVEKEIGDMDVIKSPLFWLFSTTIVLIYTATMVRAVLEDTICISLLGENQHKYGEQRMWGAIGWGIMSFVTGVSVDWFSKGLKFKMYSVSFIISLVCYVLDACAVSKIENVQSSKDTKMVTSDIKKAFTQIRVLIFILWVVAFGFFCALISYYLFWYLEDISVIYHPETQAWIKTIQGLAITIQCFGGEVPFFFLSSFILKHVDHMNVFSLMFFTFAVRFFLYSLIRNPVWVLPVELLNGITFALSYSAAVSYASVLAPPGAEGTLQGVVGTALLGIGSPIGSFVGGTLFDRFGSIVSFKILSGVALGTCVVQIIVNQLVNRLSKNKGAE